MIKITDEQKKIIEENPVAVATINEKGKPHVIAVAYVKVTEGKLIVTDNYMKSTKENIQNNKNVSLAVWDKDWNGFRISGEAEYFSEGKWHEFVKAMEENKNEPCKGAIAITPTEIKKLG